MAGLGTATPRAKRPRRESRGDLGQDLRLSATEAATRQRAKSRRTEGAQGGHCQPQGWDPREPLPRSPLALKTPGRGRRTKSRQIEEDQRGHCQPQGWDPWEPVLCSPLALKTPGKGRLAKSRRTEAAQGGHCQPQGWDPWDPVPCSPLALKTPRRARRAKSLQTEGGQGESCQLQGWAPWDPVPCSPSALKTPGRGRRAQPRLEGERRRLESAPPSSGQGEPVSPQLEPCYQGPYFSGLPTVECQDLAPPSLLIPAAPAAGRNVPRKTRNTPERTLILELEGTLVCSSLLTAWRQEAAATFTTEFQGDSYEVHVKLRPHVQQFLESLSKTYEIFIFTTAKQDYTEKVLEVLLPRRKLIRHCLSQQDCLCAQGCYWKDLTRLGRDLDKMVALDHTIQGFPAQDANWIPVPRWCGERQDEELLRLMPLLAQLSQEEDTRAGIRRQLPRRRLPPEDCASRGQGQQGWAPSPRRGSRC